MLKKREQLIGIAQNSLASEGTVDPNLLKEIQFMVEPDVPRYLDRADWMELQKRNDPSNLKV